jgi:hypothetical protein
LDRFGQNGAELGMTRAVGKNIARQGWVRQDRVFRQLWQPAKSPRAAHIHCTALHCTALNCTELHCTSLHCTALHCTELHCTACIHETVYIHRIVCKGNNITDVQLYTAQCRDME